MHDTDRHQARAASVIHELFDDEVVIVDLEAGTYFSVDRVGADVWQSLLAHRSRGEICDEIAARYSGERTAIAAGVNAFIDDLLKHALIVRSEQAAKPGAPAPASDVRPPFAPPRIEPYSDMKDLLLLDPIHEVDEAGWPRTRAAGERDGE